MAAAFLHLSDLFPKLGIDFGTVNYQHQFCVQINTSHIKITGADNADSIVCQNCFCMQGLFSQILINMYAGIPDFFLLIQIVCAPEGIGAVFNGINQDSVETPESVTDFRS